MGASNVVKAYTFWSLRLDHLPMRALCFMAVHALDADDPPRYWGGWEAIAEACGKAVPADKPAYKKRRARLRRYATDVLATLVKAGAVVSSGQARAGVRAEYALNLDPHWTHVPNGTGRNVAWLRVPRSSNEDEVGTRSLGTADTGSSGTPGTGSSGTGGTVSSGTQGTTGGTTEEYKEEEGETQATQLRAVAGSDMPGRPDRELSEDAERQRQLRELEALMAAASPAEAVTA